MIQIKELPIKTVAGENDLLVMQDPSSGQTYGIKKSDLLAGLSNDGGGGDGGSNGIALTYSSDGDSNGLFYYIGTTYLTATWANPTTRGLGITASSTEFGILNSLVNRDNSQWYSNGSANNFIVFQLPSTSKLRVNHYSIKTRDTNVDYYPRNWKLQGSNDGINWVDIDVQVDNTALNSISQWLSLPVASSTYFSWFRLLQNGVDSSGAGYFCLSEVELYGIYN